MDTFQPLGVPAVYSSIIVLLPVQCAVINLTKYFWIRRSAKSVFEF
jgi:hypothetical protein